MHFSLNRQILELALIDLRDSGYFFQGKDYYSELQKNTLKEFLKSKWGWNKKQIIKAIHIWINKGFINLENDILTFETFPTPRKETVPRIISID